MPNQHKTNRKVRMERAAFADMYRQYRKMLLRHATSVLAGDVQAAEDVVDEAFLDIWKNGNSCANQASEASWMRRIVRNKAVDWLRKYADTKVDIQSMTEIFDANNASHCELLTAKISDRQWLGSALSNLSFPHRQAILLFYYEELPLCEIALITETPENTVKTRLYYARRALVERHKATV